MKIKEWPPSILPPWKPVFRRSNRQQKEEGQRGISVRLGGGTHSPLSLLSHPIYLACRKPRVKHQFLPIHPFHLASSPAIVRVFSSLGSDHKPRDCFSAVTISKSSCTPPPRPHYSGYPGISLFSSHWKTHKPMWGDHFPIWLWSRKKTRTYRNVRKNRTKGGAQRIEPSLKGRVPRLILLIHPPSADSSKHKLFIFLAWRLKVSSANDIWME